MKIYFAGPNVFHPQVSMIDNITKKVCAQFSIIPLIPTDSELPICDTSQEVARVIFNNNVQHINNCDLVIANTTPFRGACVDDGTAWEIGMAYALNKPVYTYSFGPQQTKDIIISHCGLSSEESSPLRDSKGCMIEDFGLSSNLMISCAATKHFAADGNFPNEYETLLVEILQEITQTDKKSSDS